MANYYSYSEKSHVKLQWPLIKLFVAQIQFMMVLAHTMLILQPSCTYPKIAIFFLAPNSVIFFYLFNDFYQQAYKKSAAAAAAAKQVNGTQKNGVHKNGIQKNGSPISISACYSPDSKLD